MKQLTCEMCGSTDMVKQDGAFVCQTCGMKYSVEEAKKMMIEGTVDVQGTVKIDNSALVNKYLTNARRALEKEDWEEVEKYYNMVEQNASDNIEAVFFSSYGKAMLAMTDQDYFKREQKFKVLNRSMSVISDYYDTTNEDKEAVLRKITDYINKMYNITFVFQRQSFDLVGAVRSINAAPGTRQWCINLIDGTKKAFITELQQIAEKHDDKFVKDLLNELAPQPAPVQNTQKTNTQTIKPANNAPDNKNSCNKWVSLILCLFLGFFGVHKFYEGDYIMGIVYILTFGLFYIGAIVDIFLILAKPETYPRKNS